MCVCFVGRGRGAARPNIYTFGIICRCWRTRPLRSGGTYPAAAEAPGTTGHGADGGDTDPFQLWRPCADDPACRARMGADCFVEAGLLAFDLERLRRLGGSVLSAFPMLSGPRDGDPREL